MMVLCIQTASFCPKIRTLEKPILGIIISGIRISSLVEAEVALLRINSRPQVLQENFLVRRIRIRIEIAVSTESERHIWH